jgi:hypothetical protein
MNNDNTMDIIIWNYYDNNMSPVNSGDGTFISVVNLPDGALYSRQSVVVADRSNGSMFEM